MKKRDIIPVHEKAIEIIDKAEEANNGDLQLKNERERDEAYEESYKTQP